MKCSIQANVARLLLEFANNADPPSQELIAATKSDSIPRLESEFDRLVFILQNLPDRSCLYLANCFLNHSDVSIAKITVDPDYLAITGTPQKIERKNLTGFKIAFWAEAWKLARESAFKMQKTRVHSDSELEFQKYCTKRLLETLAHHAS